MISELFSPAFRSVVCPFLWSRGLPASILRWPVRNQREGFINCFRCRRCKLWVTAARLTPEAAGYYISGSGSAVAWNTGKGKRFRCSKGSTTLGNHSLVSQLTCWHSVVVLLRSVRDSFPSATALPCGKQQHTYPASRRNDFQASFNTPRRWHHQHTYSSLSDVGIPWDCMTAWLRLANKMFSQSYGLFPPKLGPPMGFSILRLYVPVAPTYFLW